MTAEVSPAHADRRALFARIADGEIGPHAEESDRRQRLADEVLDSLRRHRCLGSILPDAWGGAAIDMVAYGLLHEEIGRVCSSTRSIITVHDMVAQAVLRCGTASQRVAWLPHLAVGELLAAFAVTEAAAGSDVRAVEARVERQGAGYVLNGTKKWVTGGEIASVYLVLAQLENRATAFLVERTRPGVAIAPVLDMLGLRAAMLAEIHFECCELPPEALLGRPGFGVETVVQAALDLGRYSVAWGSVGIAQASMEAALQHADTRRQFGVPLREHQLIGALLADMATRVSAARLLCLHAGALKDANAPAAVNETLVAKYFAARAAMQSAVDAVQVLGAQGCSGTSAVQRYLRDAKIMEIIEGSHQIQQLLIAQAAYQEHARRTYERRHCDQSQPTLVAR